MKRVWLWLNITVCVLAVSAWAAPQRAEMRLAILPLQGDEAGFVANDLRSRAQRDVMNLLDADLTQVAAQGAGYQGSLNLNREEARALGQSLGCDFFVLGKVLVTRRQVEGEPIIFEALTGLFFVEARTGKLVHFGYHSEKAKTDAVVRQQLLKALPALWQQALQAMRAAQLVHQTEIETVGRVSGPLPEIIRDDELKPNDKLPTFYQRLKPDYSDQANAAGITATVELEAVFQADGTVAEIEVLRWAGFGLDEAAIATVKKMRFRPAQLNEKNVSLRGLVRYNFRRPAPLAERADEAERLKRSLRNITNPVIRP